MFLEDKSTPHQRIAKYFVYKMNVKANQKTFVIQMNIAKSLLKDYSEKDLYEVIDYLSLNQPKNGVYSLKYLEFVMDSMLPKAKAYALRNRVEDKGYDLTVIKEIDNTQKRKKRKSMFA